MDWDKRIRDLWIEFLFWTRFYILSQMHNQRGLGYVASRILRNAAEFADVFIPFYGQENARRFQELLSRHILLLSEFSATIRTGQSIEVQRIGWYQNANDISEFLASINPYWNIAVWMGLLYQRFSLEESLLLRLQESDFFGAIDQFDIAQVNAEQIADYMIDGIAMQFEMLILPQQSPLLQSAAQTAE